MRARNQREAVQVVANLNMDKFVDRAIAHGDLKRDQVERAKIEYRQFMLLIWLNESAGHTQLVVPTVLADAIWHEHIMFTREYREFCENLVGKFIDHVPGLEKGTEPFNRAVVHTRELHRKHSDTTTFAPNYLGGCGGGTVYVPIESGLSTKHAAAGHTSGDHSMPPVSASDGHSDGSSHGGDGGGHGGSDGGGASCGASCGGGGCGGGCGGG